MPSAQNWKSQGGSFPLTHSSAAVTTSSSDQKWYPRISFCKFGNRKKSLGTRLDEYAGGGINHARFALQNPLQLCKCGLSRCPVTAKHLYRVNVGVFHGLRFSAGPASLHNTLQLLYFSWIITSQNAVVIILPADGCVLNFLGLGDPGPTHWRLWALYSGS